MLFAEAVLESPGILDMLISSFKEGREYLIEELNTCGYQHKGDAGNFLFIKPKTDAYKIVNRMKTEKKILIKVYPDVGEMGNCLRVSVGEKKYMQKFVEALLELDK